MVTGYFYFYWIYYGNRLLFPSLVSTTIDGLWIGISSRKLSTVMDSIDRNSNSTEINGNKSKY